MRYHSLVIKTTCCLKDWRFFLASIEDVNHVVLCHNHAFHEKEVRALRPLRIDELKVRQVSVVTDDIARVVFEQTRLRFLT